MNKFNDLKKQRIYEEYEDYLAMHSGQCYHCMSWQEFYRKHKGEFI